MQIDELTVTEEKIIEAFREGQKENFHHSVLHNTSFRIEMLDDDALYVVLINIKTNEVIKKIKLIKLVSAHQSVELNFFFQQQLMQQGEP